MFRFVSVPGGASPTPATSDPTPTPSTSPPTLATTPAPTPAPTESPDDPSEVVEVADKTSVTVEANGYDERSGEDEGDVGCGTEGCLPELTRDNDWTSDESRWSCQRDIVSDDEDCEIEFSFGDAQDVVRIEVAFYKPDERTRELQVNRATRRHFVLASLSISGQDRPARKFELITCFSRCMVHCWGDHTCFALVFHG